MATRVASATRPITLKDILNKRVCGIGNCIFERKVHEGAATIQRGFIHSRSLLQNVLGLDTAARAAALRAATTQPTPIPVAVAFDYATAFPSLSQEFLAEALTESGMSDYDGVTARLRRRSWAARRFSES